MFSVTLVAPRLWWHDIYTTNLFNKSPSNIVVPSPDQNNTTPIGDQAAADPTLFDTNLLQTGNIHLHSWMLHSSQAPVLDLTGKDIESMKDIENSFHALNLCPNENNEEKPNGREETGGTKKTGSTILSQDQLVQLE